LNFRGWRDTFGGLAAKALLKPDDSINCGFKYFDTLQSLNTVPAYHLINQTKALHRDCSLLVPMCRRVMRKKVMCCCTTVGGLRKLR